MAVGNTSISKTIHRWGFIAALAFIAVCVGICQPTATVPLRSVGPHIVSGAPSRICIFDGVHMGVIEFGEPQSIDRLPVFAGIIRDASQMSGAMCIVSTPNQNTLELRRGEHLRVVQSYCMLHRFGIEGAVIDTRRRRLITIGADEAPPPASDSFVGPGSVRFWNLDGSSAAPPYYCDVPPVAIARDWLADIIVVGTQSGWVHVFRSDKHGLEPVWHYRLDRGRLEHVSISFWGNYVGATGDRGAVVWNNGKTASLVSIEFGPFTNGGGQLIFFDDLGEDRNAMAIVCLGRHIWIIELGADPKIQGEFDLEIAVESVGRSNRAGEVLILGKPDLTSGRSNLYALNVESRRLVQILWAENDLRDVRQN